MTKRRVHFLAAIGLGFALMLRAADNDRAVSPSRWVSIMESAIAPMDFDGTLRLGFLLGSDDELLQFKINVQVLHRIVGGIHSTAQSTWVVTGLNTSLAPMNRDALRWSTPWGTTVIFKLSKIGRSFEFAGDGFWQIRHSNVDSYEIRGGDGMLWKYANGYVKSVDHPNGARLIFETRGALITAISKVGWNGQAQVALWASYSISGNIEELHFGAATYAFVWECDTLLEIWHDNIVLAELKYKNGLLSTMLDSRDVECTFTWKVNEGFHRGDSRFNAAAYLASDNTNRFSYDHRGTKSIIRRRNNSTGDHSLTIIDRATRMMEQRTATYEVSLSVKLSAEGKVIAQRIFSHGALVGEYSYDKGGRLTEIVQGEEKKTFIYDQSGRLEAQAVNRSTGLVEP